MSTPENPDEGNEPRPEEGAGAPDVPGAQPSAGMPPQKGGPGVGAGVGFGCLGVVLVIVLMFGTLGSVSSGNGWLFWAPPALLMLASLGLAIAPATRRVGIGMLTVVVAFLLLVVGPCVALLNGI